MFCHSSHSCPIAERAGRKVDDFVSGREARTDSGRIRSAAGDFDATFASAAILDGENGPSSVAASERADGNEKRVLDFLDDNRYVHPEPITERRPLLVRRSEVDHHPNALLLDPKGGDFRERAGLDETDAALQRLGSAPMLNHRRRAGPDSDRVRGQNIDDHLQIGRVADLEQRLPGAHGRRTLPQHSQNPSGNGAT